MNKITLFLFDFTWLKILLLFSNTDSFLTKLSSFFSWIIDILSILDSFLLVIKDLLEFFLTTLLRLVDFSLVFETIISRVSFNTIELRDDVSFTLTTGMTMELANYSNVDTTDQVKLIYAFRSDGTNNFPDGAAPYVFV